MKILLTIFSLFFVGTAQLFAQTPGTLDTSFSGDGIVRLDRSFTLSSISGGSQYGVIQGDGKIVIVGSSIARLLSNGTMDATFDGDGIAPSYTYWGHSIAIQPDGKYIIGSIGLVSRYNPDGSLDGTPTYIGFLNAVRGILVQPDGKIIIFGHSSESTNVNIARLNVDLTLDSSFGSVGWARIPLPLPLPPGTLYSIGAEGVLQPDGKIVVGGYTIGSGSPTPRNVSFMVRCNSNGSLDAGFGEGGVVMPPTTSMRGLALLPDGKIFTVTYDDDRATRIARYLSNGSLDSGFGSSGSILLSEDAILGKLAVQPNGKILASFAEGNDLKIFRYNADGSVDASFGEGGNSSVDIFEPGLGSPISVVGLFLQPDGKSIILADQNLSRATIVRLNGDPTPASADLSITMRSRPRTRVRQTIRYAINLRNNGPARATNVIVEDTLPTGVDFVSATIAAPYSCAYTESSRLVRCTLPGFVSGYSYSITLTVIARRVGTVTNTVTVRSDMADLIPGNNTASYGVAVGW